MHNSYDDIRSRIAQPPSWWDENGTPRYSEFSPRDVADIYAASVALVLIACQNCRMTFKVAMSWPSHRITAFGFVKPPAKREEVLQIHYGDPPNIGCCGSGPTMNCEDLRVLEWWDLSPMTPVRKPEFEIVLPDHPEYGGE